MSEKRKYPRYACKIKSKFDYFEGNPDTIDIDLSVPEKGKGLILDISKGGLFLVSDERVAIGMPIKLNFKLNKQKCSKTGKIVRTGLLSNNPSELAQKFSRYAASASAYIAVEFDELIEEITEKHL